MTLDELCREYPSGTMIYVADQPGRWWMVQGVVWSLPEKPGGPDQPGIVATDRHGHIGCILPHEARRA